MLLSSATDEMGSPTKRNGISLAQHALKCVVVCLVVYKLSLFIGSSLYELNNRITTLEADYRAKQVIGQSRMEVDCLNGRHAVLVDCERAQEWARYQPRSMAIEQALREGSGYSYLQKMGTQVADTLLTIGDVLLRYGPFAATILIHAIQWIQAKHKIG